MPTNKLKLRSTASPYTFPIPDVVKGSVLDWAEVDNNFIFLKGLNIQNGVFDSNNLTMTLTRIDGSTIDISGFTSGGVSIYEVKLVIPTADVLTLNSVPIELIPAPGVGFAIELISASMKMVFNSVAYATYMRVLLLTAGAAQKQVEFHNTVLSSASSTFNSTSTNALSGTKLIENAAVNATVDVGDPTAGDSDITIYATYRIITL